MSKLYFEAATVCLKTQRLMDERVLVPGDTATDFATQPTMKLDHKPVPTISSKI
jgi:hypothetical protein